jgi:hypothetical protein
MKYVNMRCVGRNEIGSEKLRGYLEQLHDQLLGMMLTGQPGAKQNPFLSNSQILLLLRPRPQGGSARFQKSN